MVVFENFNHKSGGFMLITRSRTYDVLTCCTDSDGFELSELIDVVLISSGPPIKRDTEVSNTKLKV